MLWVSVLLQNYNIHYSVFTVLIFRCDRILSYGKGMRLISYWRKELKFSDHRPVTATYMAEVEVFSPKKLQRALTFTDAEIENEQIVPDMSIEVGMNGLKLEQVHPSLFIDIQPRQQLFQIMKLFVLPPLNAHSSVCIHLCFLKQEIFSWER